MNNLIGRRFIFATIAIICVSVTAILLKYNGDIYFKLVSAVTGIFLISQSVTDAKKIDKK